MERYTPGHVPTDVDFRTGAYNYRDHDGSAPKPGDLPNRQGVHVVRRGRLVRLHDIAPESEKQYFDPDDVIEDPPTSARAIGRHADDSAIPGLVGFITEAQRRAEGKKDAAGDKRKAKGTRRAAAARASEEAADMSPAEREIRKHKRKRFAQIAREQKTDVSDLRRNGFSWEGGWIADRYYPAFTDYFGTDVMRTDLHPMLKFWWSTIPAKARVGVDKTFVEKCYSKQLAGNFPYIEGDPAHCRWIFKEIDGAVFMDAEHCYAALQKIFEVDKAFAGEGIDMMPNFVCGHTREDGMFEAGHLIWMFKPGSSVWTDMPHESPNPDGTVTKSGNQKCKAAPIQALNRTRDSLCKLLLPIGGDPGQTNHRKPKSPTSAFTTVLITNENNLFELADFPKIRNYPLKTNKKAMYRDAEIYRAATEGVPKTLSMERWNKCMDIASAVTLRGRMGCEPAFLAAQAVSIENKNPVTLALWVEAEMRARVGAAGLDPGPGLDRVIKRQSTFAARLYMKPKGRRRKVAARGRDRSYVVKLKKLGSKPVDPTLLSFPTLPIAQRTVNERRVKELIQKARRKEAGRVSASINASRTRWKFGENASVWFSEGGSDDFADFVKNGLWSVSRGTAKRYWDWALAEFSPSRQNGAKRYIASCISGQRGRSIAPSIVPSMPLTVNILRSGAINALRSEFQPPPDPGSGKPVTSSTLSSARPHQADGEPCDMLIVPDFSLDLY